MSKKPYVPEPEIGLVYQEQIGERYVVIARQRSNRRIGVVEIHDKLGDVKWLDRTDWTRGFGLQGWLTV